MEKVLIKPENALYFIQENTPGYNPLKGSNGVATILDEDIILVNNGIVYGPNLEVQIQVEVQVPCTSYNRKDKYVAAFNYVSREHDSTSIRLEFKNIALGLRNEG